MAEGAIVFRLEFGGGSGWGHLARCAALAAEMRTRRHSCVLWTTGNFDGVPSDFREFDHVLSWKTGCVPTPVRDAELLVVDHYGIDDARLRALRAETRARLLVIDDEAKRRLDAADFVLNSRLGLDRPPYESNGRMMLGELYALLRPGLRKPATVSREISAESVPVLVMLGGTDPAALTVPVLEALADVDADRFVPVVVGTGRTLARGDAAGALKKFKNSIRLETIDASELAAWAHRCRFAVSAAGGTLYELAYLRLPFVAVVAAENQQGLAAAVHRQWHLPVAAAGPGFRRDLAAAVRELVALPTSCRDAFANIDGLGASRVADVLKI